jgi:hypothetical protein
VAFFLIRSNEQCFRMDSHRDSLIGMSRHVAIARISHTIGGGSMGGPTRSGVLLSASYHVWFALKKTPRPFPPRLTSRSAAGRPLPKRH